MFSCFLRTKEYLYASARCKKPRGESFLPRIGSLLQPMCDTAQLVTIRFWRMGHGRVVKTLATTAGGEGCFLDSGVPGSTLASTSWSNSLIYNWYLPAASSQRHVFFIQNDIPAGSIFIHARKGDPSTSKAYYHRPWWGAVILKPSCYECWASTEPWISTSIYVIWLSTFIVYLVKYKKSTCDMWQNVPSIWLGVIKSMLYVKVSWKMYSFSTSWKTCATHNVILFIVVRLTF